jgi:hypothetical protein
MDLLKEWFGKLQSPNLTNQKWNLTSKKTLPSWWIMKICRENLPQQQKSFKGKHDNWMLSCKLSCVCVCVCVCEREKEAHPNY